MKLSKELAKKAQVYNICKEWYLELKKLSDKKAMVRMYLKGIDFCLANDYPGNDFIRKHFKGEMEELGVFLDDNIDLENADKCVALGGTKGRIEVNGYGTSEIFVKNESAINIIAKDNAFVMVDIFDNATVFVTAQDKAKVCVNKYGEATVHSTHMGESVIKIVDKYKKTY